MSKNSKKNPGGATSLQELMKHSLINLLACKDIMVINASIVQILELLYQILHYSGGYF